MQHICPVKPDGLIVGVGNFIFNNKTATGEIAERDDDDGTVIILVLVWRGDTVVIEIHARERVPRRGTYQFAQSHDFCVEIRVFAGHSGQVDCFFREMKGSPDGACAVGVDECGATNGIGGFRGYFDSGQNS